MSFGERLILVLIGMTWTSSILAQEYPYLFRTAYFKGRGDTGIAIAEGEDAIFYNPAGLAISPGILNQIIILSPELEMSTDARDVAQQLAVQNADPTNVFLDRMGIPQHGAVSNFSGVIFRRLALGVFMNASATGLIFRDPEMGATETVQANGKADGGAVFSVGDYVWGKKLSVGIMGKFIEREQASFSANAADANQVSKLNTNQFTMLGSAFGADIGVMYRGEGRSPLSFGVTVQDVGNTIFTPAKHSTLSKAQQPLQNIKQTLNAGIGFETGTKVSKFRLLGDVRDILDAYGFDLTKRIHLGGEIAVAKLIGFTFGLNQGYPSCGFYLDLHFLRGDAGYYTEEIGDRSGSRPDNRYFMRITVSL